MPLPQPVKNNAPACGRWPSGFLNLLIGLGTVIASGVVTPRAVAQQTCEFLLAPEQLNTQSQEEEGVIRIGNLAERPYLVILPGADETDLAVIRPCILDAYLTRSRLGRYLQVGAFSRYSEAAYLARTLRANGFSARVVHQSGLRR